MTPIEKNVSVVDEQGNEYEATYPKRAKGLVKNGRARFVSENKICLACPPNTFMEDNSMSDTIENTDSINTDTAVNIAVEPKSKYSLDYALGQIEKISTSTAYLDQAISELRRMETSDGVGDIATQAKAQAIADVVRCRETTNQKLLDFYMRMVDELIAKPKDCTQEHKSNTVSRLDELSTWLKSQNRDEYDDEAWNAMLEAVKGQMAQNY